MAENENRGVATIRFGDVELPIRETNVLPLNADILLELRNTGDGRVALGFGSIVANGNGHPEAIVCCRIRIPTGMAIDLRQGLDNLIKVSGMPADTKPN